MATIGNYKYKSESNDNKKKSITVIGPAHSTRVMTEIFGADTDTINNNVCMLISKVDHWYQISISRSLDKTIIPFHLALFTHFQTVRSCFDMLR